MLNRLPTRMMPLAVLALALPLTAHAQATPEAAVKTFLDGFNTGDMAKSGSVNSPSGTTIIDEFAPFTWTGTKAFDDWGAAYDVNAKANGITDGKVTLSAPLVKNVTADKAYLIYPALYVYKQKGVAMREDGRIALALRKEAGAWKIAAWTWTGTVPKATR